MGAKSATPEEIVDGVIELFAKSRDEARTNAEDAQSAYGTAKAAEEQAEPAVQQKVQKAETDLDSSKAALSVHDAAADAASDAKGAATQIAASGAAAITKPPGIPKSTVWIVVIVGIVLVLALALPRRPRRPATSACSPTATIGSRRRESCRADGRFVLVQGEER